MKDHREVKIIIGWQITKDIVAGTMKIDQSIFIKDFVIEEHFIDCNVNIIPMKIGSTIEITSSKDYKKTKLQEY